jgi:hypothetical protein
MSKWDVNRREFWVTGKTLGRVSGHNNLLLQVQPQ